MDKKIVYVTNLNNSGKGSLRYELHHCENNTDIIFNVSGVIKLKSVLNITDKSNVSIYGETSIQGHGIIILGNIGITNCTNVTIRYLKIRSIDLYKPSIEMNNSSYISLDHLSLSWGNISIIRIIKSDLVFITNSILSITNEKSAFPHPITIINNIDLPIHIYMTKCMIAFIKSSIPKIMGSVVTHFYDNILYCYNDELKKFPFSLNNECSYVYTNDNKNIITEHAKSHSMTKNIDSYQLLSRDKVILNLFKMLNNVGSSYPSRDILDTTIINDMLSFSDKSLSINKTAYDDIKKITHTFDPEINLYGPYFINKNKIIKINIILDALKIKPITNKI